jgi:ankyrin repeat protein
MVDPGSVPAYAQTIAAITLQLQKRHKDSQVEVDLLDEGRKIAGEIDQLASKLPTDVNTQLQDEVVQLSSTLSDIRESFSSAKSRKDLKDAAHRLETSRAQLLSIVDKDQNSRKPDEGRGSDQPSLLLPGQEDDQYVIPTQNQNARKTDETTRLSPPYGSRIVYVEGRGFVGPTPALAFLDTGSSANLVSERFLYSLEGRVSWPATISRRLGRFRGSFPSPFYSRSRDPRDWLDRHPVKLKISLSSDLPQAHDVSFTVHQGTSFFGDMLLGREFLDEIAIRPQSFAHRSREERLIRIDDHQEQTTADIIFVHSVYGDASETWRGKSNSFWPKHFLAKDVENCSIWTYGYDMNQTWSNSAESFEKMMDDLANDLLKQIDRYTSKPILWICHSLGGHLVKFALTRSHARRKQFPSRVSRFSQTKGVIFLGTPHRIGTSVAVFEDIVAVSLGSRREIGKQREIQNHNFDNSVGHIASAFASLIDRESFPIVSLFENKPMLTKRGPRTIVQPFTRMHHPKESWNYLEGDHLSICKFETREERGYRRVLASVRDLLEGKIWADDWQDVERNLQGRSRSKLTSFSDTDLVDINKIYLNLRLKIDSRIAKWNSPKSEDDVDSTWIRNDPVLKVWLDDKKRRPLLIRGPIGCGKSKIAESIQEWLDVPHRQSFVTSPNSKTCHLQLFFKSDQRAQQTPVTMLEFLIAQILDQNDSLVYHVKRKAFSTELPVSLAHALLQETLRMMLEDTGWGSIYLVVDALDECSPEFANAFLDTLVFILKIENVRSLLTISTTTAEILGNEISPFNSFVAKSECIVLDLPQNSTWIQVLTRYTEGQFLRMKGEIELGAESSERLNFERLKEAILRLPVLSFAIIDLALQRLREVMPSGIRFELELKELEDRARIDSLLIDLANTRPEPGHWVLSVLACAFEPLRLQELAMFFARDPKSGWEGSKAHEVTIAELQSLIDKDLRLLVRIDGDGLHLASQLVCQVINDRMARSEIIGRNGSKTESGWYDSRQLHLVLSKICLQILLERTKSSGNSKPDARVAPLAAEGYARRHWENHLREAGDLASDINGLVMQWMRAQEEWSHDKVKRPSDLSSILLKRLIENNLFRTMGSIFDEPNLHLELPGVNDIDRALEQSTTTPTPDTLEVLRDMSNRRGANGDRAKMFLAMADGNKNALAQLLRPLDAPSKTKFLRKSIEMQDEDMVQTILDSYSEDHDVPQQLDELEYAVQFQSYEIVRRMLRRRELFNLDSALLAAVDVADSRMCEALLVSGARVFLGDKDLPRPTPLHVAAQRGKMEVVDLLLKWSAPVNFMDSRGQTPLHHAAKSGRLDIVKMLIARSASVEATDKHGWTALFSACAFGQADAAKLLWSSGSSIFHRDNDGRSMLHSAAKYGHEEVVKMLLSAGISAECADNDGITPLHESCRSGWAPIVEKLIQREASIDVADMNGRTCLHHACQCSDVPEGVVRLLLDMGADASARDRYGCTPLMVAARSSTVRVMKIFWTHDRRLFSDTDLRGSRVPDYLEVTGGDAESFKEKEDFLARYAIDKFQQPDENRTTM